MADESEFERGYHEGFKAGYNAGRLESVDEEIIDTSNDDDGNEYIVTDEALAHELGVDIGRRMKVVRDINGTIMGYI